MVYNKFTLNELMKPKYAFVSSGLFFILLGFMLFDNFLIRAGNIVLFIGVLLSIKSLEYFKPILLFFLGFVVSFKLTTLGLLLELFSLIIWGSLKVSSSIAYSVRILKKIIL